MIEENSIRWQTVEFRDYYSFDENLLQKYESELNMLLELAAVCILGFLTVTSSPVDCAAFTHELDEALPGLLHVTAWLKNTSNCVVTGTTFVYAMHGRSTRMGAWPLDLLLDSNEQLTEVSPSVNDDTVHEYCLPVGGITAGLCGNIVLLWPR